MRTLSLLFLIAAGCSGDGGGTEATHDTPAADDTAPVDDTDTTADTDTGTPATSDTGDTGAAPAIVPCPAGTPAPSTGTTLGCVQGRTEEGVEGFLGIPYAQPPLDALRWVRPQPGLPWSGVRDATEAGPICPQSNDSLYNDETSAGDGDEDCLTLNVLRPSGTQPGDDLPVLFWIHGGGHVDGAGSLSAYLGTSFAQAPSDPPLIPDVPELATQAVVVTINYRLGPLGFLAHRGLTDADPDGTSGNQGLWDALLALQWVHANATELGGDPDQLMVFGESAGAVMTCNLVASAEPDGLIAAAVLQSGNCLFEEHTLDTASEAQDAGHTQGDRVAEALGCADAGDDAAVLGCMRGRSTDELLRALPARLGLLGEGEVYGPVIDGVFLTEPPLDTFADGRFEALDLVVGANADEATVFTLGAPITSAFVLEATLRTYAAALGWDADALVDLYAPGRFGGDPSAAWNAFVGDSAFVCPTRQLAELTTSHVPTYAYFFTWHSPLVPFLGAGHGFEIPFVFGTGLQLGDDVQLSEAMVDAWVSVAAGAPTASGQAWPTFGGVSPDGGTWLHLEDGGPLQPITGVRQAECDWMASQGFLQP